MDFPSFGGRTFNEFSCVNISKTSILNILFQVIWSYVWPFSFKCSSHASQDNDMVAASHKQSIHTFWTFRTHACQTLACSIRTIDHLKGDDRWEYLATICSVRGYPNPAHFPALFSSLISLRLSSLMKWSISTMTAWAFHICFTSRNYQKYEFLSSLLLQRKVRGTPYLMQVQRIPNTVYMSHQINVSSEWKFALKSWSRKF